MFFVRALFEMKEGERACEQIFKLIPITHKHISTTPFVMPNSYGENEDLGIDGESMSDWYTGSSNTLLKAIVFDMFGIRPKLGSRIVIDPTDHFPSDNARLSLTIKGHECEIVYENAHLGERNIFVNGKRLRGNSIEIDDSSSPIRIKVED